MSTTHHHARRRVVCLVASLLSALALTAPAASAHDGWPAHQMGALQCSPRHGRHRRRRTASPRTTTSTTRTPSWSSGRPICTAGTGARGPSGDGSAPWNQALTTLRLGYTLRWPGPWQPQNSAVAVAGKSYLGLPPGHYTIRHYVKWPQTYGAQVAHAHWHDVSCQI